MDGEIERVRRGCSNCCEGKSSVEKDSVFVFRLSICVLVYI